MALTNLRPSIPFDQITIEVVAYTKALPPEGADWIIEDQTSGVYTDGTVELPKVVRMTGTKHRVYIGAGSSVRGKIDMSKGNGALAYFGPDTHVNIHVDMRGGAGVFAMGEGTTCESGVFFVHKRGSKILIGDDCLLAAGVVCRTYDGHSIYDRTTLEQIALAADISIGAHVWLANGVRVSKGANIGSGCIIGQMSLVTGSTDENCIYAGTPARCKRTNIVWSRDFVYEAIPERFR